MRKSNRSSALAVWIGFAIVCFLILASVLIIQFQKPAKTVPAVANPTPVEKKQIQYDILEDIDQAPTRRMLTVMLPRRISELDLKVLSHQIRLKLPTNNYKFISIRFHIPGKSFNDGVWARSAFYHNRPEEIEIHGKRPTSEQGR